MSEPKEPLDAAEVLAEAKRVRRCTQASTPLEQYVWIECLSNLIALVEQLREANKKLHRRAQAGEAAARITIEQCEREGVNIARLLLRQGYESAKAENADLKAKLEVAERLRVATETANAVAATQLQKRVAELEGAIRDSQYAYSDHRPNDIWGILKEALARKDGD